MYQIEKSAPATKPLVTIESRGGVIAVTGGTVADSEVII